MSKQGRVTFYNPDKGFGFLRPDDGGRDQFAHASALIGVAELRIGQRVSFEIVWDDRSGKEKAADVRVVL